VAEKKMIKNKCPNNKNEIYNDKYKHTRDRLFDHVIIINPKVLFPQPYMTLTFRFGILVPKDFKIILDLRVPDEGYSRNASCALNLNVKVIYG
jgi:hypothetical protein